MTTEMLTVAVITAHGHQCKTVHSTTPSPVPKNGNGNQKNGYFQSPVTKRQTNVPDIPHTLSSNFYVKCLLKLVISLARLGYCDAGVCMSV